MLTESPNPTEALLSEILIPDLARLVGQYLRTGRCLVTLETDGYIRFRDLRGQLLPIPVNLENERNERNERNAGKIVAFGNTIYLQESDGYIAAYLVDKTRNVTIKKSWQKRAESRQMAIGPSGSLYILTSRFSDCPPCVEKWQICKLSDCGSICWSFDINLHHETAFKIDQTERIFFADRNKLYYYDSSARQSICFKEFQPDEDILEIAFDLENMQYISLSTCLLVCCANGSPLYKLSIESWCTVVGTYIYCWREWSNWSDAEQQVEIYTKQGIRVPSTTPFFVASLDLISFSP